MIRPVFILALCTALSPIPGALAQTDVQKSARTPVVLELFTSEGCSSCPPADRLLAMLDASQPFRDVDLIVLSEHVDYWNNGGWSDPFSAKAFSARQERYAQHFGLDSVYTPQRVVDGQREGVGGDAAKLKADIGKAANVPKVPVLLSNLSRTKDQIKFHATSGVLNTNDKEATLYVALARDRISSDVRHGENAGHSLTHVAVVRTLRGIGAVKRGSAFSQDITLNLPPGKDSDTDSMRVVAFLQVDKTQQIIGAAQSKL